MNWKFWQKSNKQNPQLNPVVLTAPSVLPEPVAKYLVVTLKQEAEWVWGLKAVERSRPQEKRVYDVRVFDQAQIHKRNIDIRNYNSLDAYPELIAFEGWYNRKTREAHLVAGLAPIRKAA